MIRKLFLVIGAALFVYLSLRLGPARIGATLMEIGWAYVPVVIIAGVYQAARAAALAQCTLVAGLSYRALLAIRLSGQAVQSLTFTGPFLAEPTKAWLIGRRGVPTVEAFAGIFAEYLVYTWLSAILSIAGLTWMRGHPSLPPPVDAAARAIVWGMIVFLAVSAVAVVFRIYLIGGVVAAGQRLPVVGRRIRIPRDEMRRLETLLLGVLRERPAELLRIALVDIVAHGLLVLEVWWILAALDTGAGLPYAVAIEGATKFASLAFFFIPAQVGAAEALNAAVFGALALAPAAGFTLAFVRRLRMLLVAAAGLAALARL